MSVSAFSAAVTGWHDFYLAAAGASAALLGLLFVGVSINLAAIAAKERPDLRARAGLAFSNLIYVLVVSLVLLVANPEPHGIALGLGAIAGLGLIRTVRGCPLRCAPSASGETGFPSSGGWVGRLAQTS